MISLSLSQVRYFSYCSWMEYFYYIRTVWIQLSILIIKMWFIIKQDPHSIDKYIESDGNLVLRKTRPTRTFIVKSCLLILCMNLSTRDKCAYNMIGQFNENISTYSSVSCLHMNIFAKLVIIHSFKITTCPWWYSRLRIQYY